MKHISLFSGIGGFDLAAEWMGWQNVAHCEWNPFGQRVLKYYWPDAITYEDITKTYFTVHRGTIDILTGGFPCQPYSVAGKRKGKEDERHLWPEMLRAIREIQPSWVVGENVGGLLSWNGGLVFDEVQADLEAQGYEVLPFLLPAAGVNAPHKRDRIWFIAYSDHKGRSTGFRQISETNGEISERNENTEPCNTDGRISENPNENGRRSNEREEKSNFREQWNISSGNNEQLRTNNDEIGIIANTESQQSERMQFEQRELSQSEQRKFRGNGCGLGNIGNARDTDSQQRCERRLHPAGSETPERYTSPRDARCHERTNWQNFPTQPPICDGNDGISTESLRSFILDNSGGILTEKEVDKILSKTIKGARKESIKAGGNAIVPQVAYQIFKAIEMYEKKDIEL